MHSCDHVERCFCWNGDDDGLRKCIQRNQFVKNVRNKLAKNKFKKNYNKKN